MPLNFLFDHLADDVLLSFEEARSLAEFLYCQRRFPLSLYTTNGRPLRAAKDANAIRNEDKSSEAVTSKCTALVLLQVNSKK